MTTTESLVATTTREITMSVVDADTTVRNIKSFPAGTEVYVTRIRDNGSCVVRVCGSLYRQHVTINDITPA